MPGRLRVVHYMSEFPSPTQTFIAPILEAARDTEPEVWALRVAPGVEAYPWRTHSIGERTSGLGRLATRAAALASGFSLGEELRLWWALKKAAKPDVLHAHFGPQGFAAAQPCSRFGVPEVTTFYGYDIALGRRPRWRARYSKLWKAGAAFLTEGPFMRRQLLAMGAPPEKVYEQPLPLRVEGLTFRPRSREPGQPIRVLQVARFVEKKGIDLSIRAVARLARQGRSLELRVVGDGPLRSQLTAMIEQEEAQHVVTLLGAMDHRSAVEEMSRAHLLIQPSRTAPDGDTEGGAPYTLLEAQAMGLCLVATDHADIPNVVAGDACFSAREGSLESVVAALHKALEAENEWPLRAEAGRRFVVERNAVNTVVRRLEALYRSVARRE